MNKLLFALICSFLIFTTTMTIHAQESNIVDSVYNKIALNDKEDIEIRRFADSTTQCNRII